MNERRHLYLVGFMGAGKSTVGRILAEKLGRPFVDLDSMIEAQAGESITSIFESRGEDRFRELESAALKATEDLPPTVIACGGGVVLRDGNRALLKRLGTTIYLEVSAGEAVARIGDGGTRPLLAGPGGVLAATSLLAARESLYSSVADLTLSTSGRSPGKVASEIAAALGGGQA